MSRPARVIFSSHDGYGLGHVRRNARLAAALRSRLPDAELTVVTGIASDHSWLGADGVEIVRVPGLVKDAHGHYRHASLSLADAVAERSRTFEDLVDRARPDLLVIDRHPFGIQGELKAGIRRARRGGAAVLLGLRDILDDPAAVRRELAAEGWLDVPELIDEILVYGHEAICDQELEYRLPMSPTYCGIVVDDLAPCPGDSWSDTLLISAGGGADGQRVTRLARRLSGRGTFARTVLVMGPAAGDRPGRVGGGSRRMTVHPRVDDCGPLLAKAAASLQMAGYNSTYEALSAGIRPLLVPRRAPRREQAIRATRLSALGLADVVDRGASTGEVAWLLNRPRRLDAGALDRAGLSLHGADAAAERMCRLMGLSARGAA